MTIENSGHALGLQYGIASENACESGHCDTWWYRVESLDGAPFPKEVEIIGFSDDPAASNWKWPDKRVYKLVSFVRPGRKGNQGKLIAKENI